MYVASARSFEMRVLALAALLLTACGSTSARSGDDTGTDAGTQLRYNGPQRCGLAHRYRFELSNEHAPRDGGVPPCEPSDSFEGEIVYPTDLPDGGWVYLWVDDAQFVNVSTNGGCTFGFWHNNGSDDAGYAWRMLDNLQSLDGGDELGGEYTSRLEGPRPGQGEGETLCLSRYDVRATPLDD
jgi:hypothetical protein